MIFCLSYGQDSTAVKAGDYSRVTDLLADDYGNVYTYREQDFTFIKQDSLGTELGKLMFTFPFAVLTVQNPLYIPAFSENRQQLKIFDRNLSEIQSVDLSSEFGYVKAVFAEDLQQIWLADASTKRLVQYSFRTDQILNTINIDVNYDRLISMTVYEGDYYLLFPEKVGIYNFRGEKRLEFPVAEGRKLRREKGKIFVLGKDRVWEIYEGRIAEVFAVEGASVVEKNLSAYFVINGNKLYLYPIIKK